MDWFIKTEYHWTSLSGIKQPPFLHTWLNAAVAGPRASMQTLQSIHNFCWGCGSATMQSSCQPWYQQMSSWRLGQWNLFMPWRCIPLTFTLSFISDGTWVCFIVIINDAPLSSVIYLNHFCSPRIIWCLTTCWGLWMKREHQQSKSPPPFYTDMKCHLVSDW